VIDWPVAAVLCAGFASLVALAHVGLPYLRKRGDAEAQLEKVKADVHDLSERMADVEDFARGGGPLGRLPRAGRIA